MKEEKEENSKNWKIFKPQKVNFEKIRELSTVLNPIEWIPEPELGLKGLKENWKQDIKSGFFIFLLALPLCLGIAMASGVPVMAGIIAAIVGGMIVSQFNGSFLTINGPAAGLIVVILGAVQTLGNGDMILGYQYVLAAIVVSGILLIIFSYLKLGVIGYFFPNSVIHGMMSAIGVIIIAKQIHIALGTEPNAKEPLQLLMAIPNSISNMNLPIALIGLGSFFIMLFMNVLPFNFLKKLPTPLFVIIFGLIMSWALKLKENHEVQWFNDTYFIGEKYLINLPDNILAGITFPNWSKIGDKAFWFAVLTITFIQGLESLLATIAIDKIDPYKRHSELNKDLKAIGIGNIISGMIGGLPMIAEIVRSSANVNAGAKTQWSNFFHGFWMLIFILFFPKLIEYIPTASLAALLVFTGFKLASPKQITHIKEISIWQLTIFLVTTLITLATDLLIGVFSGVLVNFLVLLFQGKTSFKDLITSNFEIQEVANNEFHIEVKKALVFSNFLYLKSKLDKLPINSVIQINLNQAKIIDHAVLESLKHLKLKMKQESKTIKIMGLKELEPVSSYSTATRIKRKIPM